MKKQLYLNFKSIGLKDGKLLSDIVQDLQDFLDSIPEELKRYAKIVEDRDTGHFEIVYKFDRIVY